MVQRYHCHDLDCVGDAADHFTYNFSHVLGNSSVQTNCDSSRINIDDIQDWSVEHDSDSAAIRAMEQHGCACDIHKSTSCDNNVLAIKECEHYY